MSRISQIFYIIIFNALKKIIIYSSFESIGGHAHTLALKSRKNTNLDLFACQDADLPRLFDDGYRKIPYVKDIIDYSIEVNNLKGNDIIIFTNSDIIFFEGILLEINQIDNQTLLAFHRKNIDYTNGLLEEGSIDHIRNYLGIDCFVFTVNFRKKVKSKLSDTLFATEFRDHLFDLEVRLHTRYGVKHLNNYIYHIKHYQKRYDTQFRTSLPSQLYNINIAKNVYEQNYLEIHPLRIELFKQV